MFFEHIPNLIYTTKCKLAYAQEITLTYDEIMSLLDNMESLNVSHELQENQIDTLEKNVEMYLEKIITLEKEVEKEQKAYNILEKQHKNLTQKES